MDGVLRALHHPLAVVRVGAGRARQVVQRQLVVGRQHGRAVVAHEVRGDGPSAAYRSLLRHAEDPAKEQGAAEAPKPLEVAARRFSHHAGGELRAPDGIVAGCDVGVVLDLDVGRLPEPHLAQHALAGQQEGGHAARAGVAARGAEQDAFTDPTEGRRVAGHQGDVAPLASLMDGHARDGAVRRLPDRHRFVAALAHGCVVGGGRSTGCPSIQSTGTSRQT